MLLHLKKYLSTLLDALFVIGFLNSFRDLEANRAMHIFKANIHLKPEINNTSLARV